MDLHLAPLPEDRPPDRRTARPPRRFPPRKQPTQEPVHVRRVRQMSRPILWSVLVHAAIFALLGWMFLRAPRPAPESPIVTVAWREFSDLEGPEASPGGRDPRTESPSAADAASAAGAGGGFSLQREADEGSVGVLGAPIGELWAGRAGGKQAALREGGGDAATEGALHAALDWLARHQNTDGTWNGEGFGECCSGKPCDGRSERPYVEGSTGLALLAFLGAGHTHRDGEWRDTVRRGLEALLRLQKPDGLWAVDAKRTYTAAIATLALAEAHAMTGSRTLRSGVERAVAAWCRTQSKRGGWRYDPGDGTADSSITAWVALALRSAEKGGIAVPAPTMEGCRGWFRWITDKQGGVGYTSPGESSATLLGTGLFVDVMLGASADTPRNRATASLLARKLPRFSLDESDTAIEYGVADPSHWYAGSLGAFQVGGVTWERWEPRLRSTLLPSQEHEGCARGSWPALGATGRHGGRVVTTALCALCLEVYYRYPRATLR